MQARTLWLVLEHIDNAFGETELPAKYRLLVAGVRQAHARTPVPADVQNQLRTAKQALVDAHQRFEPVGFRDPERQLFAQLGGDDLLGRGALAGAQAIFDEHIGHFAVIGNLLETRASAVEALRDHCRWLLAALRQTVRQPVPAGTAPLTIRFGGATAPDDLEQLGGLAVEWTAIARAMTRLVGEPPDAPKILSMERGSLSLTLALRTGPDGGSGGSLSALCNCYRMCAEICLVRQQGERAMSEMESLGVRAGSVRDGLETRIGGMKADLVRRLVEQYRGGAEPGAEMLIELEAGVSRLMAQIDRGARLTVPTLGSDTKLADERRQLDEINDKIYALEASADDRRAAKPIEAVAAKPVEAVTAKPIEAVTAKPVEAVAAKPIEAVTAKPIEAVAAKPIEAVAAKPIEAVAAKPIEEVAAKPIEVVAAKPLEAETAKPIEAAAVKSIEAETAKPIEAVAAKPIEAVAAKPIDKQDDKRGERPGARRPPTKVPSKGEPPKA
jgi:hypothetical protein